MVTSPRLFAVGLLLLLSVCHVKARSVENKSKNNGWKRDHYHIQVDISLEKEDDEYNPGLDHTVTAHQTTRPDGSRPPTTPPGHPTTRPDGSRPPTTPPGPTDTKPPPLPTTYPSGPTSTVISSSDSATRPFDWQPEICVNLLRNSDSIPIFEEKENQVEFIPGPPFTAEEIQSALLITTVPDIPIEFTCTTGFLHNELSNRAVVNPNWPLAELPYEIDIRFSKINDSRQLILNAIKEIEDNTCIKIIPKEDKHINWMEIRLGEINSGGCFVKYIGLTGVKSPYVINLEWPGCSRHGTIIHEILHVLGFEHEHIRLDRDNFVTINWDNLKEGDRTTRQFCKVKNIDTGHPYDYESVMHYGDDFFQIPGSNLKTIDVKGNYTIGQRNRLSQGDINQINHHYCNQVAQVCTTGWQQLNNKQYCFTEHKDTNWYQAISHCQRFGAGVQLAILDTAAKRTAVHSYMTNNTIIWAWVGATSNTTGFYWLNGNQVTDESWDGTVPTPGDNICVYASTKTTAPKTLRRVVCTRTYDTMNILCEE